LAELPFINNECDPQVGWGTIHTWRARPYYAALVAKVINQHLVTLIDDKDVDYGLLSNDNGFLGTWGHRTLLARFAEIDHIDHGQAEGKRDAPRFEEDPRRRKFELIKKPIFDVMTMLSLLGDERCPVAGPGGVETPLGVIATRRGAAQIAVLIYNSADKIMTSGSEPITLRLEGIPFESAALTYYRIDEGHGDPFTVWEAMDAPDRPTEAQYAELREHQELATMAPSHAITVKNGTLVTSFNQPLPGVTLVLVSARMENAPKRVAGLRFEHYEGMSGKNEVLVMWDGLDSRVVRTYEVLFSIDKDGPYHRINAADQVDTAFLHVRDVEKGFYSVRAVDYWNRYGDAADPVAA
jgi:L-iduronidase